jgi:hypothetical protein
MDLDSPLTQAMRIAALEGAVRALSDMVAELRGQARSRRPAVPWEDLPTGDINERADMALRVQARVFELLGGGDPDHIRPPRQDR